METSIYHWLIEAVGGLLAIGLGLSVFGQAVIYKARGESARKWFVWGTLSLIAVNAGLCLVVDAAGR